MTGVVAHIGHAPWQIVLIAVLYLSLAAGVGIGMLIGKKNRQPTPTEPGSGTPGWDPHPNNGAGHTSSLRPGSR